MKEYFGSNIEKRVLQAGLVLLAVGLYFAHARGGTASISAVLITIIFVLFGVASIRNKILEYDLHSCFQYF